MRRVYASQASCCGPDMEWSCQLCTGVSCFEHDPSPGELSLICDLCWNPADFPEGNLA